MSNDSPAAIIYSSDGYEATVHNAVAIPANTPTIIAGGSDGTNARYITVDSSGRQVVVGAGVAGTQTGGVLTIQGDPAGTPIPISGSISATNPSVGTNNAAIPASSTQVGGSDGTNLQALRAFDLDTGGGTEYNLGTSWRLPGSGGSVAGGTATNPIRIDPTGSTTQPVSGTVTAVSATAANFLAEVGGLGASGAAIVGNPVRIGASDGTNTRDLVSDTSGRLIVIGGAANGAAVAGNPVLIAGYDGTNARTLKTDSSGDLLVVSTPVKSATATSSNVASATSNTTLLASNANRLGATIYNDSSKRLYLKLGATASTTSFTTVLYGQGYYEVPASYTGNIDGIWDAAAGSARMCELT